MKQFKMGVGAVAVVGMLGLTQQVAHAEELPKADLSKAEAGQLQKGVSQSDVTTSQAKVVAADEAVKKQAQATSQAQEAVTNAENNVVQKKSEVAEAEKLVAEATPENVAKAETSVEEATGQVERAEKAVSASQTAQETAEKAVVEQTKVTAEAQKPVETKEADVKQAEEKVAEKQAILDGTGTKEILEKAEQTQAKIDTDKKAVAQAQTKLTEAKQADQKRASGLADAEKAVLKAQIDEMNSKSVLEKKAATASKTAEALEKAIVNLTKANQDAESINQIKLSQEYIAALREYSQKIATASPAEEKTMTDKLVALGKVLAKQNRFKANKNDGQEKLDLNNLSEATREEMSLFAADLLNQIHTAFVTSKIEVSKDAAKIVHSHISSSKINGLKGHDTVNLKKVLDQYGISSGTEENIGLNGGAGAGQFVTKSELKHLIYNTVLNLMFNAFENVEDNENNEFLHASSLAGLFSTDVKTSYLGVGTSFKDDYWQVVNFLLIHDKGLVGSSFNQTVLSNPFDSRKLLKIQKEAQSAYNAAKQDDDRAQADKSKAEADYKKATDLLTEVTAQRDAIKAMGLKTPAAQAQLDQSQATLKADEAENKAAQEAVAQLNADVKVKQAALAQAKAELSQQQSELEALKNSLSVEQNKLAAKQVDLTKAQALVSQRNNELVQAKERVTAAEAKVRQLKEAPKRLAQAKQSLLSAKQDLVEKQALFSEEKSKLAVLKEEQAEVFAQHTTIVKVYQAQLEAERLIKLAAQKASIEQAGGQDIPVFDETGKIVSYVDAKKETVLSVSNSSNGKKVNVNYNVSASYLPSTGEAVSLLGIVTGAIFSIFSFVSRKHLKSLEG